MRTVKTLPGGVYVAEAMTEDLRSGRYGKHASNLGALHGLWSANKLNIPCYIVDPVVVDELQRWREVSAIPRSTAMSIFHALNQKAVAQSRGPSR